MISPGRCGGVRGGASRALGLIPLVVLVEGPAEKAREFGLDLLDRERVADARRRRGGGLGLRGRRLGARRGRRLRGWRCGGWRRSRDRRRRRWARRRRRFWRLGGSRPRWRSRRRRRGWR